MCKSERLWFTRLDFRVQGANVSGSSARSSIVLTRRTRADRACGGKGTVSSPDGTGKSFWLRAGASLFHAHVGTSCGAVCIYTHL